MTDAEERTVEVIVPRIDGWRVTNPVPVLLDDEPIGLAVLELTHDPKTLRAVIRLDPGRDPSPVEGHLLGLRGTIVRSHRDSADGPDVVDEVAVKALVVE